MIHHRAAAGVRAVETRAEEMVPPLGSILLIMVIGHPACRGAPPDGVRLLHDDEIVGLENTKVRVEVDRRTGTLRAVDRRTGLCALSEARCEVETDRATRGGGRREPTRIAWTEQAVADELGAGRALLIRERAPDRADRLLEIVLHAGRGEIVLRGGIHNTTPEPLRVMRIAPLARARAFDGLDLSAHFRLLDGNGGGQVTRVTRGKRLACRNNLLVLFGPPGDTHSLVLGGLTYHEFEKFAAAGERLSREGSIAARMEPSEELLCYLDLPAVEERHRGRPGLKLIRGKAYTWGGAAAVAEPALGSVAFDESEVIVEADGLDPEQTYRIGFSWWDFDRNSRRQSVSVDTRDGGAPRIVFEEAALPAWRGEKKPPVEGHFCIPPDSSPDDRVDAGGQASRRVRVIFSNASDAPNAVVSEVWLSRVERAGPAVLSPLAAEMTGPPSRLRVETYGSDPVGRLVDSGQQYLPDDRFYVDFTTSDPFEALERYGRSVRMAQRIRLEAYDFPTICLWYAEVYGHGQASNDTPGAVREMEKVVASGFLETSRVAIRLVPDLYADDNQQGWWDDWHWRRGRSRPDRGNGQYAEPYETSATWAGAVRRLGGIPLTYVQTGFRSEDYARAHPDQMLFNEAMAPRLDGAGRPLERQPGMNAWERNRVLQSYDYTDPAFSRHMHRVYADLKAAGVRGLMFDYPSSGWAAQGGMEDRHATTAEAYRRIFALAREGLGAPCWIHERALARGSDVALGLITSQRVWGDTDQISPEMVTRCGLRWYKNRVVVNYDMDAKNLLMEDGDERDRVRALLTMCAVVSGRLLLANSFGALDRETLRDLSRVFPFPSFARSSRPVDAFEREIPCVYDLPMDADRHQLTLYNPRPKTLPIEIDLGEGPAFGGLGLDGSAAYDLYDFWNDRYIGRFAGDDRLVEELRPGEARMISVRRVKRHPQVISTDRHLLQGLVDLLEEDWSERSGELRGRSRVTARQATTLVIALNGSRATGVRIREAEETAGKPGNRARAELQPVPGADELMKVRLESESGDSVAWVVTFQTADGE